MSPTGATSPTPGWGSLQPFHHVGPPGPALTAVALFGGLSIAGVASVRPHLPLHIARPPSTLIRISPMGYLVLEAGFSYLEWLHIVSGSLIDPINYNISSNNQPLYHSPLIIPTNNFIHSKDLIVPPSKEVAAIPAMTKDLIVPPSKVLSVVPAMTNDLIVPPSKELAIVPAMTKDLVLVDLSPVCKFEYNGSIPYRKWPERIVAKALAARKAPPMTCPVQIPDSFRWWRQCDNGAHREEGSDPSSSITDTPLDLEGSNGHVTEPTRVYVDENDPDGNPDDDPVTIGQIYPFPSGILIFLIMILMAILFSKICKYLRKYLSTTKRRIDITGFFLFFILFGPGADKRRSIIAHFLGYEHILQIALSVITAQHEEEHISDDESYSTEQDQDREISHSSKWKGKGKMTDVLPGTVARVASLGAKVENATASSSRPMKTFARLYIHPKRSHPSPYKNVSIFVQADNPNLGFICYNRPDKTNPDSRSNNFHLINYSVVQPAQPKEPGRSRKPSRRI